MNILVIGCDQVGASLVRDLERIGHDISIIEKDSEQLKRLDAFDDYTFSGNALVGDPTDPDVLRQGGIENCDAVAACRYSTTRLTNWTPSAPPSSPSRPCSVLSPNNRYHLYNEVAL